jgi:hypothetical protein
MNSYPPDFPDQLEDLYAQWILDQDQRRSYWTKEVVVTPYIDFNNRKPMPDNSAAWGDMKPIQKSK